MTSIRATDASIAKEILVVGLARDSQKKLRIESGSLKVAEKQLLVALDEMGATGKADEVIKLPGTTSSLLVQIGRAHV